MSSRPVLDIEQALALEKACLGADEGACWDAILQAGSKIGHAILQDFREMRPLKGPLGIMILAGKGHNAADAFIAAKTIVEALPKSWVKIVWAFGREAQLRPFTLRALELLRGACVVEELDRLPKEKGNVDILMDGILGVGANAALPDPIADVFRHVNTWTEGILRVAIDLPTGLGLGSKAFRADFTYTTGCVKSILLEPFSKPFVGRLRFIDIGFFNNPAASALDFLPEGRLKLHVLTEGTLGFLKELRSYDVDKRGAGHLLVVAGSASMPGASLMASTAGLFSGVGLLNVATVYPVMQAMAGRIPEAMWFILEQTPQGGIDPRSFASLFDPKHLNINKFSAMLMGPGLGSGPDTHKMVALALQHFPGALILDADALVENLSELLNLRPKTFGPVIMTPHVGEFERISGVEASVQFDDALRNFAIAHNCVVVLKGPISRLCGPDGRVYCSFFGGPVLARGGTGDILGGLISGIIASQPNHNPAECAACGLVWHGLAADALARECGQVAVRTTLLIKKLEFALRNS